MATDVMTEQVLVVPTDLFHRLGYFQGFSAEIDRYLETLLSPTATCYREASAISPNSCSTSSPAVR